MSAVAPGPPPRPLDAESQGWLRDLRGAGAEREDALARLHALLLRAARFEVVRRAPGLPHLRGRLDEIALEAADDALMSVVARLDDFRGASRFSKKLPTRAISRMLKKSVSKSSARFRRCTLTATGWPS